MGIKRHEPMRKLAEKQRVSESGTAKCVAPGAVSATNFQSIEAKLAEVCRGWARLKDAQRAIALLMVRGACRE